MTSRERVAAVLGHRRPDHLPCMPITMQFAADRIGKKYYDYVTDYRVLVEGQLRVAEEFGVDHVGCISDPTREAAERLNKLFGDQNSSWERLARTEMAAAAERAKTDEWKAWKVKKVDFVPAPDACPICTALKGEYKIEECPVIPVHPRCRCSKRPAKSETA